MSDQKHLAYAVASWLSSQASSSSNSTKLEQASQNVCDAFDLNLQDSSQKAIYGSGPGLKNVWDVFVKTQAKMGGPSASTSSSNEPSADTKAKAESLKGEGNKAMSAKDYGAAIASYSQAIELDSKNPVYFSNRSAAYAQIGQHDKAIEDAREASKVDPKFSKAYSRLGHALFSSGCYEEAVEAYEKGVEVDPNNALMKSGLETARQHAKDTKKPSSPTPASRDVSDGGAADAGMGGGFPGMGGGAGGMPDLSAMMNNPMIAQMAQSMMANGGLEQMMNNPMIQQMMSRFGGGAAGDGGGGGMPDINAMMQDPQMREMARNFMGGAGGGAGAGAGAGAGRGAGSGGNSDSSNNAGDNMFS